MKEKELLQEKLYNSLKLMINWTWEQQRQVRSSKYNNQFDKKRWSKDFCTVKFCLPRRSGHTTMIEKLCGVSQNKETALEGIKPIVLFPSIQCIDHTKFKREWEWVGTPEMLGKFIGVHSNIVICDMASLWTNENINKVYKQFESLAYSDLFVFLFIE